jgi:hypothetical protein
VQNLEVARGIPQFSDLDVRPYCELLDQSAAHFSRWLPRAEREFLADPEGWDNDLVSFRLGMLCQFIDQVLGVCYNEHQRDVKKISYTDPSDLFLNGVLDKRQGTCGNMGVLYYSLCWRLGWPVSLALTGWHELCRYDDGKRTINVETSNIGMGAYRIMPDEEYIREDHLAPERVASGSDLTALRPRQVLGVFFGNRGRYWYDQYIALAAKDDYGRAVKLFPESWLWREKRQNACLLAESGLSPPSYL